MNSKQNKNNSLTSLSPILKINDFTKISIKCQSKLLILSTHVPLACQSNIFVTYSNVYFHNISPQDQL